MEQRYERMPEEHARAAIAHDRPDPIPHKRFVAVYLAFPAHWFALSEGALIQPEVRIIQKIPAFPAQVSVR